MSRHVPKFGYQLFGLDQPSPAKEGYDLELDIYDVIGQADPLFGGAGVSAAYVLNAFRAAQPKNALVRINSPGGSTTEGFAIYNILMEHAGKVTTRVDGMAGSMASIVLLAGEEREMAFGGTVMIHNPFGFVEGEARELRGVADMLDRQRQEMLAIYSKRTGLSVARVAKMVDNTTWMGGEEALELGFVTRLTGRPMKMVAAATPEDIAKAPPKIRALLAEQAKETLAAIRAAEKGESPGSSKMDEEQMKAEVAKALEAAKAAIEAVAKKDEEMAAIKAALEAKDKEIAKLQAELAAKAAFPFKKDDEESSAASGHAETQMAARVVQAAVELTGVKELGKLEGALLALADAPKVTRQDRAELVGKLVAEGKLAPARRTWALGCTKEALDAYLEGTGGMKVAAVSVEHKPDDEAARKRAQIDPSQAVELTKDELVIAKTMGTSKEKALELKKQRLAAKAS